MGNQLTHVLDSVVLLLCVFHPASFLPIKCCAIGSYSNMGIICVIINSLNIVHLGLDVLVECGQRLLAFLGAFITILQH